MRGLRIVGLVVARGVARRTRRRIALLVYAAGVASPEPHHGQAVDGLDGIGNFSVAMLAGLGGLLLVVGGGFGLRAVLRASRT